MDTSYRQGRAEDRAMIQAVVHRYAHTARDKMDFADMVPLFTADAAIVLPGGVGIPPNQLRDVLRGEEAKFIRHHITTIDIRFLGQNEAAVESFFLAVTNEAPLDHWGFWRDKFVRQSDGSWLIAVREIQPEGGDPRGWLMRMYGAKAS
jgi:SnoaL-like domain